MENRKRKVVKAVTAIAMIACMAASFAPFAAFKGSQHHAFAAQEIAIDYDFSDSSADAHFTGAYLGWRVSEGKLIPNGGWASAYMNEPMSFKNTAITVRFDCRVSGMLTVGLTSDSSKAVSTETNGAFARIGETAVGLYTTTEEGSGDWLNEADGSFGGERRVELTFKPDKTISVKIDGESPVHSNGALQPLTDVSFGEKMNFDTGYLVIKSNGEDAYIDNLNISGGETPEQSVTEFDFEDVSANEKFVGKYLGWQVSEGKFVPKGDWASTLLDDRRSFSSEALTFGFDYKFGDKLTVGLSETVAHAVDAKPSGVYARISSNALEIWNATEKNDSLNQWIAGVNGSFGDEHRIEFTFTPQKKISVSLDGTPLELSGNNGETGTEISFAKYYDFDAGYFVVKTDMQASATYIDNLTLSGGAKAEEEEPEVPDEIFDEAIDYKVTHTPYAVQPHPNDPAHLYWMGVPNDHNAYVTAPETAEINPGNGYASSIVFTAPADGKVTPIDGSLGSAFMKHRQSDGVRVAVFLNHEKIFPIENKTWQRLNTKANTPVQFQAEEFEMKAGDELSFVFENGGNGNSDWDTTVYQIAFQWSDAAYPQGFTYDAGKKTDQETVTGGGWILEEDGNANYADTGYKKRDLLSYRYTVVQECFPVGEAQEIEKKTIGDVSSEELVYSALNQRWYHSVDDHCYVFPDRMNPGYRYALGVQWTAPKDGRIDVSKSFVENFAFRAEPDGGGIKSNGVRVCVLINENELIYPSSSEWQTLGSSDRLYFEIPVFRVKAGDKVTFVLDCNKESNYDECYYNVTVFYAEDGQKFTDSYNNVADFFQQDSAWKYLALDFTGKGPENVVEELPVVKFGFGGNNTGLIVGLSVAGGVVLLGAIAATFVVIIRKKTNRKQEGGNEDEK